MEFSQDARYGWRMVGKSPGFSLIVVLTLALGIQSQRFGVTAYGLMSYALVIAALVALATLSSYFSARHTAAVDPNVALRYE